MRRSILTLTLMTATLLGRVALAQPEVPATAPAPAWSDRSERAIVVATNEGNVEPGMVTSLVQLLQQAFTAKGIPLSSSTELVSPVTLDANVGSKAQAAGASRIFVLHILRLNAKTLLQLEERDPSGHSLYLTSLVPGDVEASDEILPRLADAVLRRIPATENAEVTNVTNQETGTHNRSHFVLGVPGGSVGGQAGGGISAGYQFETAQFAIGVSGTMMFGPLSSSLAVTDVYGLYYFMPGAVTPYFGAGMGVGIISANNSGGNVGPMAEIEGGVEVMRFSHTHFDLGLQAFLPFTSNNNELTGTSTYEPAFVGMARIAF